MLHFVIVLLTAVEVLVAIALIALILVQKSKSGGGLGGLAGGGGGVSEEVLGSQAGNILTRATIYCSIFFLVNTLGLAVLHRHEIRGQDTMSIEQELRGGAPPTTEVAPGQPGDTEAAPASNPTDDAAGDNATAVPVPAPSQQPTTPPPAE